VELKFCMGVQEEGMGVEEEFVIKVLSANQLNHFSTTRKPNKICYQLQVDCFFLHLHIIFLHLHSLGKFTI